MGTATRCSRSDDDGVTVRERPVSQEARAKPKQPPLYAESPMKRSERSRNMGLQRQHLPFDQVVAGSIPARPTGVPLIFSYWPPTERRSSPARSAAAGNAGGYLQSILVRLT